MAAVTYSNVIKNDKNENWITIRENKINIQLKIAKYKYKNNGNI